VKLNVEGCVTLAIGDGANDVPMIRAAHVGVGIKGHEGVQAVMASDYAIGQFEYLQDLLFVHGAWNYRRLAKLVLYSFYKNITISFTQVWFSIYSGYSGTLFYWALSSSCYNLVFTAMPIVWLALFDRPYEREIAKLCPELYHADFFNYQLFAQYILEGVCHSIIIFWGTTWNIDSLALGDGKTMGFCSSYTTMFTTVVGVVTLKVMLETRLWLRESIIWFTLSYGSWYFFQLAFSQVPLSWGADNWEIYGTPVLLFGSFKFWATVIFITFACMIPELLYKWYLAVFKADREIWIK